MQRKIDGKLKIWATDSRRKPLILRGARQVGKSWSVRNLGETHFKGNLVILNLEKSIILHDVFKQDLDPKRIIKQLELILNLKITSGKTLLFIDEIQECSEAIMALRYFYEEMPSLHVIAAGSLLEFVLSDISFPVGRVQQLNMYPLTFEEFLWATNNKNLALLLKEPPKPLEPFIDDLFKKLLLNYFLVGGMPECVKTFASTNGYLEVQKIQDELLETYKQDFNKYKPAVNVACIDDVLNAGLQKVGQQIIYTKLSDRFTMPTIKSAFEVLVNAKLFYKINNVSLSALPLIVSGKQFKTIFLDIGLLIRHSGITIANPFDYSNLLGIFKGAIAEQFVGQQLLATNNSIYYWARTEKNSTAEVDYVIVNENNIIPMEVKAAAKGALRSLHQLLKTNTNINKAIIYSEARYGVEAEYNFIPLYYAGI